jgi:hypothetical protein
MTPKCDATECEVVRTLQLHGVHEALPLVQRGQVRVRVSHASATSLAGNYPLLRHGIGTALSAAATLIPVAVSTRSSE